MTSINFIATEVGYAEAMDGEIIQLSFDEDPDQDPFNRNKCCLSISQNYEFSGKPTVEWHDGIDYDGGAEVLEYRLTKEVFELTITNSLKFKIQHNCKGKTFTQIQSFLCREFG